MTESTGDIPRDAREVYCNDKGEPVAWCPKESIGITDVQRVEFYSMQDQVRMTQLERRAQEKTAEVGEQQLVVCIDVDDPTWTFLVDMLMPGASWDEFRARGERPVARGVVPAAPLADIVSKTYPAAGDVPTDRVSVLVFAAGGVWCKPVPGEWNESWSTKKKGAP